MGFKTIMVVAGVAIVLIVGSMSVFTIAEYEQGIVVQFGDPRRVETEPGLEFKWPWQDVIYYDKRVLQVDGEPEQVTASDQKRLVVDAFALYRIVDPLMFKNAAQSIENFRPLMLQALTATLRENIGRVPLVDVVSGERQALMDEVREAMVTATNRFGIEVVDVRIKRTDLPQENSEAIYRRMQTEREREASEIRAEGEEQALRIRAEADRTRTVLISEAQRTSEILRGEGDGEVVRIFAEAFGQDVEFFTFYRTMQAYREALNADDTTLVMSPDGDFLRFLNSFEGMGVGGEAGTGRSDNGN
ncbi:MAG: HflC protein [Rhodospirillaceae bacterium]|nr:HflC protein [Rhodospirillaceae bacterium]|tara:strand:- start:121 stop:1029 length:909 start_codon:yes stop_codon:yes gene_type:complete